MNHDPTDLEFLIDHHQAQAEDSGNPPLHVGAWRNACRQKMLDNERQSTGHISRAANGLRARANGKKITHCRETRGSQGVDHVYDPGGTDPTPPWWSHDVMRHQYENARRPKTTSPLDAVGDTMKGIPNA